MKAKLWLLLPLWFVANCVGAEERGFVESPSAGNEALVVNVRNGLPGGRSNILHMAEMVSHPQYQFHLTTLEDGLGTASQIKNSLKAAAKKVPSGGTLLFYFAGHGGNQIVQVADRHLTTTEIRSAIEEGRQSEGPLARLVLIFDACHAGSHIGGVGRGRSLEADSIAEVMNRGERASQYWNKLIVMTSSRASELSWVTSTGHMFTTAAHKALPLSLAANETIGEFFKRTNENLTASHPTYKVIPEDLMNEKMAP